MKKHLSQDLKDLMNVNHLTNATEDYIECYTKENPLIVFKAWIKERIYTIEIRLSDKAGDTHYLELQDYVTALKVYMFVFKVFAEQRNIIKDMFAF
jgi:hypothetical protein